MNLLKGNFQSTKRHHVTNFQNEVRLLSLKWITWKQRRDVQASEKWLQLIEVITPTLMNLLSWHRAVCSRCCFCTQQEFECPVSYKARTSKYQPSQNPTYQIDSLDKEINKKLFAKANSLVDEILSWPRIKLSNSQTLVLNDMETEVLLSDFAQQLRRENADVPDIYLTWRCWYIPNSSAESKWQSQREEAGSLSKSER